MYVRRQTLTEWHLTPAALSDLTISGLLCTVREACQHLMQAVRLLAFVQSYL